ncbi:MAG: phytanoyl-CoA dioxygenase family protein [Pseudomonadales bacterium]|jgi:ectoine hydroxylase-related dioxygenase (phytanoyl-CoA dioxygenase family)
MNAKEHIAAIRDQGYTIIEGLLSENEVSRIRLALEPYLQGDLMGRNDFEGFQSERVYALLAKNPELALIVEHPSVLDIVDQLLEPDYLLSANLAINCHPGETKQDFHRDNTGGNTCNPTDIHGISTIWNFDDFTETNGATELIPESHKWLDEYPVEDDPRFIKAIMPRGSVLIFTGSLYHRGGANNSNRPRLAITPQYCQPWLRQLETMVLSVPPEKARALSPLVQALLGYSVRAPGFMGFVDGVHPKRLIDPDFVGRQARGVPTFRGTRSAAGEQ